MNLKSPIRERMSLYEKAEQITDPCLKQQVFRLLRHMCDMSDVAQMRGTSAATILVLAGIFTSMPNSNQVPALLAWITSGIIALCIALIADSFLYLLLWSRWINKPDQQIRQLIEQDPESYTKARKFIDQADNKFTGSLAAHFLDELRS